MQSALRDLVGIVAAIVLLAYVSNNQEWLCRQVRALKDVAQVEIHKDWDSPRVFRRTACQSLQKQSRK